ncbi:hypothetical protein [Clostridium sp. JNZ J1-5]
MEMVCPICNEINHVEYKCRECNSNMVDKGRKQEFFGNYSAEDPIDDYGNYCIHIFKCSKCDFMEDVKIRKVIM